MDCKRIIAALAAALLALTSCSERYNLELPLSLNREEMRFEASGNSYYVMVYSEGSWTASLEKDAPWLEFSRLSGSGDQQIMVSAALNTGVSRGVTLTVTNSHGSCDLYISQRSGLADGGIYSLVKESVDILRLSGSGRISSGTNLDEETISRAETTVLYDGESTGWLHDVKVTSSQVTFAYDENNTGAERSASVQISIPLARWDTPVNALFTVKQSVNEPAVIAAPVTALPTGSVSWSDDDVLSLVDADGSTLIPAYLQDGGDVFIFNADAVQGGILGAVYPESLVSRQNAGKVFISLPPQQEYITSLDKASSLVLMCGRKDGENLTFTSAGSILKLNVGGSGVLKSLSISSEVPVAGEGVIDFSAAAPGYLPDSDKGVNEISINIPDRGINLPATLYITVPAVELGRVAVNATTSAWSGSMTVDGGITGSIHEIIPVEELSFSIPESAEDLSAGKPANCYLVEDMQEAFYSIDILKPDGNAPASDITRCSFLWQSVPGLLDYLCIDAASGKLYFRKSASKTGNALLGVMNDEGIVRWSFHIWVPATPVEARKIGSFVFMDRNVGAVEADADDQSGASIGMHYQWGRKDPFPPVAKMGDTKYGKVYPDNIKFVSAQDGVSQETAHANPTTYYWGSAGTGKQDWRDVQDDNLWSSANPDANPCPAGWTVASKDALEAVADKLKAATFVAKYGIKIADDEGAPMLFAPGGWYRRTQHASQHLASTGEGYIWTSTPLESGGYGGAYRLWFQSNVNNRRVDDNYPQRRWGANVRCIKIQ